MYLYIYPHTYIYDSLYIDIYRSISYIYLYGYVYRLVSTVYIYL